MISSFVIQNLFHKHLRRAVMRYVNLSSVLALRLISVSVEKKFPDYNSLVEAKLLTEEEVKINYSKRIFLLFKRISS